MKIEKEIKIAGHIVEVIRGHHFREKRGSDGLADFGGNRILLDGGIDSESEEAQIFLHEILHHIVYRYIGDTGILEERTISSLTEGLFQVLRDNKLDFADRSKK